MEEEPKEEEKVGEEEEVIEIKEKVIEKKEKVIEKKEEVIEKKVEGEKVEAFRIPRCTFIAYKEEVGEENNISVFNSLKENYLSWICIIIAITILTFTDNYIFSIKKLSIGFFTFVSMFLLSYYAHWEAHRTINLATIIHHYHHEHTDFFSHFSQIILELSYMGGLIPLYYYVPKLFMWLNPFIIIFLILFYSSVHNINYSYFHVNKVHELHHKYINVNMGPDICDILFNTKHSSENKVENTDHYIYNIICSTIIVLIIQYLWKIEFYRPKMLCFLNSFICFSFLLLIISSLYLWIKKIKK